MKKTVLLLLLLALLSGLLVTPALAVQTDFEYLDSRRDVVMHVSWPTEQPSVVFIAPDGTEYDPMVTSPDTVTVQGSNELYYVIYNAPAGQWKINYNKRGNDSIEVAMFDYVPGLAIEQFDVGAVNGDRLPVDFTVAHEQDIRYEYKLSVVADGADGERVLRTGTGTANRAVSETLDLSELASYSDYRVRLHVWYFENDTEYFDQVQSEPFRYTNGSVTSGLEDFRLIVEPETGLAYVSWEDAGWRAEQIVVALFEDDGADPIFYDVYAPDMEQVELSFDPAAETLRVDVSVMVDGVYTAALSKTARLADCGLTLEAGEAFNRTRLRLDYAGLRDQSAAVTVNGALNELRFDGSGDVSLVLTDGWNAVEIVYTDAAGVTWRIARQIYVDRDAPILRLSEQYDGMVTAETGIEILGTVQDGSALTINGATVALEADGSFRHALTLQSGENELVVVAADALGNESRYTGLITSTAGGFTPGSGTDAPTGGDSTGSGGLSNLFSPNGYLWLVMAGVLCLLVIVYALIFWRRKGGGKHE